MSTMQRLETDRRSLNEYLQGPNSQNPSVGYSSPRGAELTTFSSSRSTHRLGSAAAPTLPRRPSASPRADLPINEQIGVAISSNNRFDHERLVDPRVGSSAAGPQMQFPPPPTHDHADLESQTFVNASKGESRHFTREQLDTVWKMINWTRKDIRRPPGRSEEKWANPKNKRQKACNYATYGITALGFTAALTGVGWWYNNHLNSTLSHDALSTFCYNDSQVFKNANFHVIPNPCACEEFEKQIVFTNGYFDVCQNKQSSLLA